MIPFSVLDLSPVAEGATAGTALRNSLDLARHVEKLGYTDSGWPSITTCRASPAPPPRLHSPMSRPVPARSRVGSGGVMLPNHSPLVIAEQFGTLESLFPGRIDLGLGRAPGTDMLTARALRRDPAQAGGPFPAGCRRTQELFRRSRARPEDHCGARCGPESAALDPGLEPVRCSACRHSGPAIRLCLAFRAGCTSSRPRNLPGAIYALRSAFPALCHGGRECDCRRYGRGGAPALHVDPAVLRAPAPRGSRQAAAAQRRCGG